MSPPSAIVPARVGVSCDAVIDGFLVLADRLLAGSVGATEYRWFRDALDDIVHRGDDSGLARAVGFAPRRLGNADLVLSPQDGEQAQTLRPGLDLTGWSVDQLARVAFLSASWNGDVIAFADRLARFAATAELNELIALYRGFPIYPAAARLEPRAREATRSAMKPIFEAIAHRNAYPREVFAEDAWNQMVVKAVFIESTLWPIQGIDARGNANLARMLVDLARERWAAARAVSGEIWRCVAPHADTDGLAALAHVAANGSETERLALGLALRSTPAATIAPALIAQAEAAGVTWPALF